MADSDTSWIANGAQCWFPLAETDKDCFKKATVQVQNQQGKISIMFQDRNTKQNLLPASIIQRSDLKNYDFDDMVNMQILNDAELLENLKARFSANKFFTYVGPTLLAINPMKPMDHLYTDDIKKKYCNHFLGPEYHPLAIQDIAPHVYATSAQAFRQLFENDKDQAIVISGESGAGKTYNAKNCMKFLTSISTNKITASQRLTGFSKHPPQRRSSVMAHKQQEKSEKGIEERILGCNPILEAFGNATTTRNDNSSRFGKYVTLLVENKTEQIIGAKIENYLLEKSRIVQQGLDQRNFHIFYHLLAGADEATLMKLGLLEKGQPRTADLSSKFQYLRFGQRLSVQSINDSQLYDGVINSFHILGFSKEIELVLEILAGILHLGNMEFLEADEGGQQSVCKVKNQRSLQLVAYNLRVNPDNMISSIVQYTRMLPGAQQPTHSPFPKSQCIEYKDSLAKLIYEKVFEWLVEILNVTIVPSPQHSQLSDKDIQNIGILDIYGFEVFARNGFEQFFINYTNEKLQQLYISYVFKEEQNVFKAEGLDQFFSLISCRDNQPVIDLLDKPPFGIFNLLDESTQIKPSNDLDLLGKIRQHSAGNKCFKAPRIEGNPTFVIVHTARDVEYTINSFITKNKDEMQDTILDMLSRSENQILANIFSKQLQEKKEMEASQDHGKSNIGQSQYKQFRYLGAQFRNQMNDLMKRLSDCDVNFIRCIQTNQENKADLFIPNMSLRQIKYLGVLESIKVRKDSYPIRRVYQIFYKRFCLMMNKHPPYNKLVESKANFRDLVMDMFKLHYSHLKEDQVLFGSSKLFLQNNMLVEIQKIFLEVTKKKHQVAMKIQKGFFRYKQLKKFRRGICAIKCVQSIWKKEMLRRELKKKQACAIRIQRFYRKRIIARRAKELKEACYTIQTYVKTYYQMILFAEQQRSAVVIQRRVRLYLFRLKTQIQQYLQDQSRQEAFELAWRIILNTQAQRVQCLVRGFLTRIKFEKYVQIIRNIGKQIRFRQAATKIQQMIRGYLVRARLSRMNRAAIYIQGFFKMRWVSTLFNRVRIAARVIQKAYRRIYNRHRLKEKQFNDYFKPREKQFMRRRNLQEANLFSKFTQIDRKRNVEILTKHMFDLNFSSQSPKRGISPSHNLNQSFASNEDNIFFSPFSPQNAYKNQNAPIPPGAQEALINIEMLLENSHESLFPNQMYLFNFVVDLQLITSTDDIYDPMWSRLYQVCFQEGYERTNYIQNVQVGETHTIAVSLTGQVYSWGWNDVGQLGVPIVEEEEQTGSMAQLQRSKTVLANLETPNLPTNRVHSITAGANHNLMLDNAGILYGWGSNRFGQLGHQNLVSYDNPIQLTSVFPAQTEVKSIKSCRNDNIAVTSDGRIFTWPNIKNGQIYSNPRELNFPEQTIITNAAIGHQFALFLTNHGTIYSKGDNREGELGVGDYVQRENPVMILSLRDLGERVTSVEVGFQHAICQTSRGHIYTWGWGGQGQLGNGQYTSECYPNKINFPHIQKIIQVQAGYACSLLMTDTRTIYWCGTNQTIQRKHSFEIMDISQKSIRLVNPIYSPVLIRTSWSNTLSIIQVTMANTKNMSQTNLNLKSRVLTNLTTQWSEISSNSVDPPFIDSVSKFISEKSVKMPIFKKPNLSFESNLKHKNIMNELENASQLFAPKLQRTIPELKNISSIQSFEFNDQNATFLSRPENFTFTKDILSPKLKNFQFDNQHDLIQKANLATIYSLQGQKKRNNTFDTDSEDVRNHQLISDSFEVKNEQDLSRFLNHQKLSILLIFTFNFPYLRKRIMSLQNKFDQLMTKPRNLWTREDYEIFEAAKQFSSSNNNDNINNSDYQISRNIAGVGGSGGAHNNITFSSIDESRQEEGGNHNESVDSIANEYFNHINQKPFYNWTDDERQFMQMIRLQQKKNDQIHDSRFQDSDAANSSFGIAKQAEKKAPSSGIFTNNKISTKKNPIPVANQQVDQTSIKPKVLPPTIDKKQVNQLNLSKEEIRRYTEQEEEYDERLDVYQDQMHHEPSMDQKVDLVLSKLEYLRTIPESQWTTKERELMSIAQSSNLDKVLNLQQK